MNNSLLLILFLAESIVVFLFFFLALKSFYDTEKELVKKNIPLESEIKRYSQKKNHKVLKLIKSIFSGVIFGSLLVATGIIALTHYDKNAINYFGSAPVSIQTGSMSKKNEKNAYLTENNLNTQFSAGSIILLDKMPSKENIKRYDVVGYWNNNDVLIVHRIIDFGVLDESGNFTSTETTAEATHFLFRGDANTSKDPYFVEYSQMYGMYHNYKLDGVGYVTSYFQSYFGLISVVGICSIVFAEDYYSRKTDKMYKTYLANLKSLPLNEEDVSKEEPLEEESLEINSNELEEESSNLSEELEPEEVTSKENLDIENNLEDSEEQDSLGEGDDETKSKESLEINSNELEEESSNSIEEPLEDTPKEEISTSELILEESETNSIKEKADDKPSKEEVTSNEFDKAKENAINDTEGKNYKAKKLEEKERKKKEFLVKKEEKQNKKDAKKTAHRLNR